MQIDPAAVSSSAFYFAMISVIVPRPIAWVSSRSAYGQLNLAPFSFFTGITSDPPTLAICIGNKKDGRPKDSARNIIETGEFVVNISHDALAAKMVHTSGEFDDDINEFTVTGLDALPSERVQPPRVAGVPASLECTLHQVVPIMAGSDTARVSSHMIIGRIELIHVDDAVVDERGHVDPRRLDAIGRMGGSDYARTRDLFQLRRPDA
jgi:flavin reductase (DIM6/NTAB) family NADH-FMN oxidoreductase RutF